MVEAQEPEVQARYKYKPVGDPITKDVFEEMEKENQGEWSEDKYFYTLKENGDFYDKYGFYFDYHGVDQYGGFYESIPLLDEDGKEWEEHFYVPNDDYEVEYVEATEEDPDFDFVFPQMELNEDGFEEYFEHLFATHVQEGEQHLKKQPEDKKMGVEILNLPINSTKQQVLSLLEKKVPEVTEDLIQLKEEECTCYIVSADKKLIRDLLKIHLTSVYERKRYLLVKLVGCPYSSDEFQEVLQYNEEIKEKRVRKLEHVRAQEEGEEEQDEYGIENEQGLKKKGEESKKENKEEKKQEEEDFGDYGVEK